MRNFSILVLISFSLIAKAQEKEVYYQTVKGIVKDVETNLPISDVSVFFTSDTTKTGGVTTNEKGEFAIDYRLGRHTITFTHIAYETGKVEIFLIAGQEKQLNVNMIAATKLLAGVVVNAAFQKEKPINKLAYVSGRSFSTEEANRYAGTLGDPARMVQSYAGITATQDDRNDIIIRGNSPIGVQWKLDGIEIPNPNHYGGIGLTGNQVTLLNMNMIDNSDFLTGAFPAEYGNVSSGVFDLDLKEGNNNKHEYRFQTGWNGFELGAEGPFSQKKKIGSYITCYRYSFLGLLNKIGVNTGIVPEYQDFTTNLHFILSENTEMSVFGLWGVSQIELDDHNQENMDETTGDYTKTGSDILLGAVNLNYRVNIRNNFKFSISALQNQVNTDVDTFNVATDISAPIWREKSTENKYSFFTEFTNRVFYKNFLKVGFRWDTYNVNYKQDGINRENIYSTLTNSDAIMNLMRLYAQDEYQFSRLWKVTGGLNFQYFFYNNSYSIEPRAALQYSINDKQTVAVAYGKHSQMQPRTIYFVETPTSQGIKLTNRNLDFSRADHYVLSYNYSLAENLRIKTEAYYQHLYNIPVKDSPNSVYSILNTGANYYMPLEDSLVNKGKGRNYGLELTVEKFLSNNYYYMLTGSVFSSEYTGGDDVWRSTSFDMSYIVNGLFGYEFWVNDNVALGTDIKLTWAGGKPYIPVDEQISISSGKVHFDYDKAYEVKYDDYFRSDVKFYYRINTKKAYMEFAVDLQNITNIKNIYSQTFQPKTGKYKTYYQRGLFPMYTFKLLF